MTTIIDGDGTRHDVTSIDDGDSPYTTTGEEKILVDTTNGAVTVTLSTADATADPESRIRIIDSGENASSNNITVNTEGSENINPGTLSSVTLSVDGTWVELQADGSNWFADLAPQVSSLTDGAGNTIADFAGENLNVDGSNVLNAADLGTEAVTSNTTTSGSGVYLVDTSDGAKTLNLSTSDAGGNASIGVANVNGSNSVSVDTEGAETIDPNADSSKTISDAGDIRWYSSDGSNWDESSAIALESLTAGNVSLNDVTGDGLPAQAIEHGKAWADDGQLYSTVQAAENAATNWMVIGPGTFSENVTIDTANLVVVGSGRGTLIDGTTGTAVTINADGVTLKNLAVQTTSGGGNTAHGINCDSNSDLLITGIWVEESDSGGIRLSGDPGVADSRVISVWCDSANIDAGDIALGANTSGNVVDDIIGTVSDSGTGNSVGETA